MYNYNGRNSNQPLQDSIQYRYNPRDSTNEISPNKRGTEVSKTLKPKPEDAYKNYQ